MIKVDKLTKKIGNRTLFSNFTYEFKERTLYFITGESGSGKTTFLNILSTLDSSYEGEVCAFNRDYRHLSDNDISDLRIRYFSHIFQNFNLLEDDTVINNLRLVFDSLSDEKEEFKNNRIEEVLNYLDIYEVRDSYVRNLSGGEKQRLAIGRSLLSSPSVLFCDEPTGSLDENNSKTVFEILRKLSSLITVIVVTHDKESAYKYGDVVLNIKNEKIEAFELYKRNKETIAIGQIKNKRDISKFRYKFLFSHIKNKNKTKRIRNFIKKCLMNVSLISTALAIGLTKGISDSISSSFSKILSGNTVVLSKKRSSNSIIDFSSAEKKDVYSMLNDYKDELDYYGVNYLVDFENHFIDGNELYSVNKGMKKRIVGFSARHFNEFIYLPELETVNSFPKLEEPLKDDEIILSINYDQMVEMCLELQIVKSFESLGDYLEYNDYFVSLELVNNDWTYSDEQLFKVKAIIMDAKNRICHTNNLFNEELFEEKMRFPSSLNLNKVEEYPRVFKKTIYLHTINFQSHFLNKIFYDKKYTDYIFDSNSKEYSPLTFEKKYEFNKVFAFKAIKDCIDFNIIEGLNTLNFNYKNYYFSTSGGYYNLGTDLFTGFSNLTFFSLDQNKIQQLIDTCSYLKDEEIYSLETPKEVVNAFALMPNSSNMKMKVTNEKLNINEVNISEGFYESLGSKNDSDLYCTMMTKRTFNGEKNENEFTTIKLKINKVIEGDKSISLYQNKEFSISLFRDLFNISSFRLIPISIIFETADKVSENDLEVLNSYFSDYEFKNPLIEIENSIDESTKFLKYILYLFSFVSLISSLILSIIISIISFIEERKEINLFLILGYRKAEISKMFFMDSFINNVQCLISSFVVLVFINLLVGRMVGSKLNIGSINLFSFASVIIDVLIVLLLTLFSTLLVKKMLKKTKYGEIY